MKKIVVPLIVMLILVPLVAADNVTIDTDKKIYDQGEIVQFSIYNKNSGSLEIDFKWSIWDNNTGNCVSNCIWPAIYAPIIIPSGGNYSWTWDQKGEKGKVGPGYYKALLGGHYSNVFEIVPQQDILAYYRYLGLYPDIVETSDLMKASDDWKNGIVPPGFSVGITINQLLTLADEWRNS